MESRLRIANPVEMLPYWYSRNRPFSYSGKESKSNDVMIQFEEFSNVHKSDRTSNATRSSLAYKNVWK